MDKEACLRDASAWLERAAHDLGSARVLIKSEPCFPDTAAYHCQQAGKAFLVSSGYRVPRTHDLNVLVAECSEVDIACERFYEAAAFLTPFAVEFRYPSSSPDPSTDEARQAVTLAAEMISWVQERLDLR